MMKRQRETKAAPRAADVDAGSCLLCGGVCAVEVLCLCASILVCVWVHEHMYLHVSACAYTVYLHVCECCGPVAMGNPAGRKSECIHPGSQGPGATQVPNEGMKGCSADVTRWGSVA